MIIFPAVDIKAGRCVRLLQGRKEAETVFSDDPAAMAERWVSEGAQWLHVIDLDGAFEKKPQNADAIRQICDRISVPVQIGGGIRQLETVQMYLDMGVSRVIIGTEAITRPDFVESACERHPGKIAVAIDARDGMAAVDGWTRTTQVRAVDLAKQFESCGVAVIIFTDIHRDGTKAGPNIDATRELAEAISLPVIASGGVSNLSDIQNLLPLEDAGVIGVITGRALYDGKLKLAEAIAAGRSQSDSF
jgi:phosphoribosylformimino-5-aminoimidazole carboxamide ribotide isomerase